MKLTLCFNPNTTNTINKELCDLLECDGFLRNTTSLLNPVFEVENNSNALTFATIIDFLNDDPYLSNKKLDVGSITDASGYYIYKKILPKGKYVLSNIYINDYLNISRANLAGSDITTIYQATYQASANQGFNLYQTSTVLICVYDNTINNEAKLKISELTEDTLLNINYCYSSNFNRYYFVNDIDIIDNKLFSLMCHVDVLKTYYGEITDITLFVERSTSHYNNYLEDTYQSFSSAYNISGINLTEYSNNIDYASTACLINVNYKGKYTNNSGKNLFNLDIKNIENITYVLKTEALIKEVSDIIKSDGSFASAVKSFYKLPIADDYLFPSDPTDSPFYPAYAIDANNTIFYNYPSSSINSLTGALFISALNESNKVLTNPNLYYINGGPCYTIKLIETKFPVLISNYIDLNHSKYILNIPFVGLVEINPKDFDNSLIYLYCLVSLRDGSTTLITYNNTQSRIIRVDNIDISMKVDTSTTNVQEIKDRANVMGTQLLTGAMGTLSGTMLDSFKNNAQALAFGNQINLLGSVANAIASGSTMHSASSVSGANNDYSKYTFRPEFSLIKLTNAYSPLNANEFGKPYNQLQVLRVMSGFIKYGGTFSNLIISGTETERTELINILKDGIVKL